MEIKIKIKRGKNVIKLVNIFKKILKVVRSFEPAKPCFTGGTSSTRPRAISITQNFLGLFQV